MDVRPLATSELLLEDSPYLNLTTKGKKTGLNRTVELWFAFKDDRLYFLAHENSHWWKNAAQNPEVEVEVSEIAFQGKAKLVPDKLAHIFNLFRKKYGDSQIDKWYGGKRARRKAVEVELGRVLGKRPNKQGTLLEIAI